MLSAEELVQAFDVYDVWEQVLDARNRAQRAYRNALAMKGDSDDPVMQGLAEAHATAASDRMDMLDLAVLRAAPAMADLRATLRDLAERRHRVKAFAIFLHAITYLRTPQKSIGDIRGMWRWQCAGAAMAIPKQDPTEAEVDVAFARFKRAVESDQVREELDIGNGPRAAAIAAVAHAHGISAAMLKRQLQNLAERRRLQVLTRTVRDAEPGDWQETADLQPRRKSVATAPAQVPEEVEPGAPDVDGES